MAFVRKQKTNLLEDPAVATDPEQEILAVDVEGVKFQYFDGTSWQPEWDSTTNGNVLPVAVNMELQLKPLREGGPARVITRSAKLMCSAPSTQPSTNGTTGGILQ
jgi:hypothetical protein